MLAVIAALMSVAVPLKIWNNTRNEMKLERHQQLLLKARMDALSRQINPHFLFNTLNTVTSLIRFDPDAARGVVLKLSNILRRLLRKHETFVPLREELQFIDDYLDIEVARFGRENLEIVKHVDDAALEAFVPNMLLQPIVENCLKHGLAPKIGGGRQLLTEIMGHNLRTQEAVAIGEGEHRSFYEIIEASSPFGWMTFDQSILRAYEQELISEETAQLFASRKGRITRGIDLIQKQRGVDADLDSGLRLDIPENAFR